KVEEVFRALREQDGIDLPEAKSSGDDGGAVVTEVPAKLGGGMMALGMMPGPIPWSDLEGPWQTAWYWAEAVAVMKGHRAHVLVTLIGSKLGPIDRTMLATRVAAAVAETHDALGVYWGSGTVVTSREMFTEMAREMSAEQLPLMLWVEFRFA